MGKPESVELCLILIVSLTVWMVESSLPDTMPLGRLLLAGSAALLLQSLLRDLSILARNTGTHDDAKASPARCMCIESAVGAVGIVVGAGIVSAGVGLSVSMSGGAWTLLIAGVLVAGLLIKDFVFEWSPWRVRRDKDHMNIIFTLRK